MIQRIFAVLVGQRAVAQETESEGNVRRNDLDILFIFVGIGLQPAILRAAERACSGIAVVLRVVIDVLSVGAESKHIGHGAVGLAGGYLDRLAPVDICDELIFSVGKVSVGVVASGRREKCNQSCN